MRFLFGSLQVKIILLIGIVVSTILMLFSYINLQILEKHSRDTIENSTILLAQGIDASIETKKRLQDPELLKREVNLIVQSNRGIEEIHIFLFQKEKENKNRSDKFSPLSSSSPDANIRFLIDSNTTREFHVSPKEITRLGENKIVTRIEGNPQGIHYIDVLVPLHLSKKVIGGIAVRASLIELDRLVADRKTRYTYTTLITVAILVIVLSLLMQLMITRPVKKLVTGMQQVQAGDLSGRISSRRKDELGRLTEQFNQMVNRLAETSDKNEELLRQIESFNKELQSRVDETTAELTLRNQELSETNERLISMQRRLWEAERLATLGQVAATIAHEIGTPLGAISGHIQLLKQKLDQTPVSAESESNTGLLPNLDLPATIDEDTKRRLDLIDKQISRVVNTVQQMLNSVRARTPEKQPVNIKEVLENVLYLINPQLAALKIKVEVNLANEIPKILMNTDALQQIFLNLFTNAMDAMPKGGTLSVIGDLVQTTESFFPQKVEIRIQDTGIGISPDDANKVFDAFFTTKASDKGTGLGLAVCKDIMERYNGTITVQSESGKGSVFILRFPV